jgi:sodium/hydrogen antiporter
VTDGDGVALPALIALAVLYRTTDADHRIARGSCPGHRVAGAGRQPAPAAGIQPAVAAPALLALATGISLYGVAELTHANPYLAAFVGGVNFTTALPDIGDRFEELGEQLSEAAKLLALLAFAMLLTPTLAGQVPLGGGASKGPAKDRTAEQ